jgi:hypothetical protein
MTSRGDVTTREMPPEMAPASESTSALRICDGSSSEAIGGGGARGMGWSGFWGRSGLGLGGEPRRVAWWCRWACGVWLRTEARRRLVLPRLMNTSGQAAPPFSRNEEAFCFLRGRPFYLQYRFLSLILTLSILTRGTRDLKRRCYPCDVIPISL